MYNRTIDFESLAVIAQQQQRSSSKDTKAVQSIQAHSRSLHPVPRHVKDTLEDHLRSHHKIGADGLSKQERRWLVAKYQVLPAKCPSDDFTYSTPIQPVRGLDLDMGIQCRIDTCKMTQGTIPSMEKHIAKQHPLQHSNPNSSELYRINVPCQRFFRSLIEVIPPDPPEEDLGDPMKRFVRQSMDNHDEIEKASVLDKTKLPASLLNRHNAIYILSVQIISLTVPIWHEWSVRGVLSGCN